MLLLSHSLPIHQSAREFEKAKKESVMQEGIKVVLQYDAVFGEVSLWVIREKGIYEVYTPYKIGFNWIFTAL